MDIDTLDPVVVGVDGSAAAGRAALWAAEDARLHHRRLVLTCADTWPVYASVPWSYGVVADLQASRRAAHDTLMRALEDLSVAFPDIAVDTEIAGGLAPAVLVARSHQAAEVVVGRRSAGAVRALVRGSTAAQVAAHAHSPVVVVPEPAQPGRSQALGVVVGVDTGSNAQAALEYAFDAASCRNLPLTAIRAWQLFGDELGLEPILPDATEIEQSGRRLVSEALAGWSEKYPDVTVHRRTASGPPASALRDASEEAALLVVGARGAGGFPGLHLGSVSEALVRHSACPVAVVR